MKTHRYALPFTALLVVVAGCASSGEQRAGRDNATLTADEIARHGHEPVEVMLQRKFPGVAVLKNADGEISLQIRGATTAVGAPKEPLYVINDMEVEPRGQGLQSLVNPYEIESIRVLRGGDAALYGVRGADGVIVIRTKGSSVK